MRVIKVYGSLAKFLGQKVFRAEVSTPAEAIRFLAANFPKLEAHMADQHYQVSVGKFPLEIGNEPGQLHMPSSEHEAIRIIPVVAGAGDVGRILAGVALFAAAIFLGPVGAVFGGIGAGLIGGTAATIIGGIGLSLALGGVASLLSPVPRLNTGANSEADPRKSYSFSGIQNVARQGVPVPIVYGETLVGSVVVSAGLNTEEVPT